MKTKQLFIILLFLFTVTLNFGQAQFTEAGIAVQGIVRDANNTAIQSKTVILEFEFYYFDDSNESQTIGSIISKQVLTDNFGVFSTIVDPNAANNQLFSRYKVWLKIKKQGDSANISESPLQHVPYAISANNGVPTGSVMPFLGTEVPAGWILCDGEQWANIGAKGDVLKAVLGNPATVPNLQGMFLRGAGTNSLTTVTTLLGQEQDDSFANHNHNATSGIAGAHNHSYQDTYSNPSVGSGGYLGFGVNYGNSTYSLTTASNGNHNHPITVSNRGGLETRPVNYGVNYIIKL